jgi:hypothetical protein
MMSEVREVFQCVICLFEKFQRRAGWRFLSHFQRVLSGNIRLVIEMSLREEVSEAVDERGAESRRGGKDRGQKNIENHASSINGKKALQNGCRLENPKDERIKNDTITKLSVRSKLAGLRKCLNRTVEGSTIHR